MALLLSESGRLIEIDEIIRYCKDVGGRRMIGRVDNENALKKMVASGLFPCIKRAMQKYEDAEDSEKSLYSTAFEIGEYVDTYHKIFQTGNNVMMVNEGKTKILPEL